MLIRGLYRYKEINDYRCQVAQVSQLEPDRGRGEATVGELRSTYTGMPEHGQITPSDGKTTSER